MFRFSASAKYSSAPDCTDNSSLPYNTKKRCSPCHIAPIIINLLIFLPNNLFSFYQLSSELCSPVIGRTSGATLARARTPMERKNYQLSIINYQLSIINYLVLLLIK